MRHIYKILAGFLFVVCSTSLFAQVRTVTFTGRDRTNQYHIPLTQVTVFNLDQLWEEVLYYPDTVLVLGSVGVEDYETGQNLQLMQNVPNPFDGTTEFALQLPENRDVLLEIYDITGKLAVGQRFSALSVGTHLFQATLSSPQTYLLSAKVDNGQMTIKMVNTGHGAGNTIRHLGMTDKNGDFTIYLKNDQAYSGYPFRVGDEMKYVGFAMIDEIMMQSGTIIVHQYDNETVPLLFDVTVPTVTTHITSVSVTSANGGGFVTNSGGSPVAMRGVCWSTNPNPTIADNHTDDGSGTGSFSSAMTDLTPNTTYYLRAYATNSVGTGYGEQITFTTPCNPMNVSITGNTAINYGQSATLTASGANSYLWSTNATTASITVNPASTTTYTVTGTNIYSCTATASITVTVNPILPTVTTNDVANITETTAVCGGNVISDGGAPTYRGVCWSTSPNPTVSGSHTMDGTGTGSFTSSITGLTPNTTYYVRAYATNSVGTGYGEQITFTTPCNPMNVSITGNTAINYGQSATLTASGANSYLWSTNATTASITVSPTSTTTYTVTGTNSYGCTTTASVTVTVNPIAPTVTTNDVANITETSAICGGNVTSDGGAAVTARGVCWSILQNPTVADNHTTNGTGIGGFSSSITGLNPNTTYYVRAYAINSVDTVYGAQKTFTTQCNTVTVNISGNTTIDYGQDATLTASGANSYRWSNNFTTASITVSLTSTTTYTVTGTNSYGCTATTSVTVIVNPIAPLVITSDVTNIQSYSASCGGNVISDGGATVTERGVCWSIFQEPTVSGSHTTNGNGTGSYSSSMTGLNPNTTYYVRAYATNSVGTVYGEVRSFTATNDGRPCLATPTVTDVDGNVYNTVQIGDQCWMRENLRTTKYADGVAIPTGTDTSSINPYYYNYTTSSIPMEQRGLLYNWPAVMHGALSSENNPSCVQGICPDGWHVPSAAEWDQLTSYVGGQIQYSCGNGIGKSLASGVGWSYGINSGECDPGNQSVYVNNVTGFSAFPAGYFSGMSFGGSGNDADFWSATTVWYEHSRGFGKNLYSASDRMTNTSYYKSRGNSVRCLRDVSPSIYSMSCPSIPTVTDVEGNTYNTVQIGNQCWMRENLRTTKYADGTLIPAGTDTSSTNPYYYNHTTSIIPLEQRGLLYNWSAVMHGASSSNTIPSHVQGICPDGWHVPSDAEWTQLTSYVGSRAEYLCDDNSSYIAKALAAKTAWNTNIGLSNTCSVNYMLSTNNATGFSALPGGSYYNGYSGTGYSGTGETTEFWSATEWNGTVAIGRRFYLLNAQVTRSTEYYNYGNSVRCLCDDYATTNIPSCPTVPTVADIDGNTYNTVQIGEQCWMRENLRTTHFADGSQIPSGGANSSTTVPYYYNYTSSSIPLDERGLLYNWPAAMYGAASSNTIPSHVQGICPEGWHLPSDAEWTQLTTYVGSQSEYTCDDNSSYIAKALATTTGWNTSTNICAVGNDPSGNNATGFGALPAGVTDGVWYHDSGFLASFWSTTENDGSNRGLYSNLAIVGIDGFNKSQGLSVRCLRDVDVPSIIIPSCPGTPTVTDIDGNTYNTVQIGNQCWMRENLRTTRYADGTVVPFGETNRSSTAPYYYDYSASPIPLDERGLLYNWPAAMQGTPSSSTIPSHVQGICPTGWHVPSNAEWAQLKNYVGGQDQYLCGNYSGSIAKALASTTRWSSSINTCAVGNTLNNNNTTGFSAIPAGSFDIWMGSWSRFINSGIYAYFWSTTERDSMHVYFQFLACGSSFVNDGVYGQKHYGYSVRCLRDSVHGSTVPVSGSPCSPQAAAQPLCLNENVSYITNSSTNVSASDYFGQSSVGCLNTTPSPSWLYIQIDQPGNLTFRIEQHSLTGSGLDVDFACWGPFSAANQDEFMERLCNHYYSLNVEHHNNNTSDTGYPYGNLVDCSYDQRYSEYCHIPNALSGEWYLLLVTNYSQQPGTITFIRDSSSTATTNCTLTADPIISGFAYIPPTRPLHNNCKANAPDYATLRAYFDANISVALPCSGAVMDTVVFYLGNTNVVADGNPDIFATADFVTIYAVVTDNAGNTSAKTPVFQLRKPAPMYITHGAISIDTLELCVDASTSMHFNNNSVMNAGEPCTYQWSKIDVVGSSVITSNPNNYLEAVVAPFDQLINTSTHFTMTVTDAYGCVTADTSNAVHFYRLPDVTVSQHPRYDDYPHEEDGAVCPNWGVYMVKATSHSNLPDSIPNYQYLLYEWSGESVNTYSTYDTTGVYILPEQNNRQYEVFAEVTNKKGCSATSSFVVTARDTTAPVFNGTLPDGHVCKSSDGKYYIPDYTGYFTNQTVSDNCDRFPSLTVMQNPAAGTEFDAPTEVAITLSDRWGNGRQYAIEAEPISSSDTSINIVICENVLPFNWNNHMINESGIYYDTLTAVNGCDSVVTLNLAVINCASAIIDSKSCPAAPTVTDHEGNVYATVQIGSQCWMRDNLRTTTSPSTGTYLIPSVGTGYTFTGKQARWYNNDSATYAPMNYGLLYNWNAAVDTFNTAYGETSVNTSSSNAVSVNFSSHRRGICPAGWHLPSDAEWTQLTTYVGSRSEYTCEGNNTYIAKALASTEGWNSHTNTCAVGNDPSSNNATGFSALPAGYYDNGGYRLSSYYTYFWSATEASGTTAHCWGLRNVDATVNLGSNVKFVGYTVRCVRDGTSGGGDTAATLPTVTTADVTDITSATATCGGSISSDGGAAVTARGVCWSTSQNPTIADSHTNDGTGTGSFISNITGLTPNTTYYVRAYATNNAGTAYGEEKSFGTNGTIPVLAMGNIFGMDSMSATAEATVTNNGRSQITACGVCWSTSPNPTLDDHFNVSDDYTMYDDFYEYDGKFTSVLTGVSKDTIYYVRAYAINEYGTGYSEQQMYVHFDNLIDVNNIAAYFSVGALQYKNNNAFYRVPKDSQTSTIFGHSLWLGGVDDSDSLHLSAGSHSIYADIVNYTGMGACEDFWPGPLSTIDASTDSATVARWNRCFKITREEVLDFLLHYDEPGYDIPFHIASWPAHGDTIKGQAYNIAPFVDVDGDNHYDPSHGDYPSFPGDMALFFVFNDKPAKRTPLGGMPIGVEVHAMVYGYDVPQDSVLNNTLFIKYKLFNRSQTTLHEAYASLWTDWDVGNAYDDHVGCSVKNNTAYAYNAFTVDGSGLPSHYGSNPPIQMLTVLGGPRIPADGLDNPSFIDTIDCGLFVFDGNNQYAITGTNFGNGIVDDERMGMTGFVSFNNDRSVVGDPQRAMEFYNLMRNRWRDGTHLVYGGNGYPQDGVNGPECRFIFPGTSDPCNWGILDSAAYGEFHYEDYGGTDGWREATVGYVGGDRRGVVNMGPFDFAAGSVQEIDYCMTTLFPTYSDTTVVTAQQLQGIDTLLSQNTEIHYGEYLFVPEVNIDETICAGGQYEFRGATYTEAGNYSVLIRDNGRDTVVRIHLTAMGNPISSVLIPDMCSGGSYALTVGYHHDNNIFLRHSNTRLSKEEIVFLPDGINCEPYGTYYRSSVKYTAFAPNDTITSADEVLYVRLKIEHSAIEDLRVSLVCPNGSRCKIIPDYQNDGWNGISHQFRTNFGVANRIQDVVSCDSSQNPKGVAWNYVWSNNSTLGYQYANTPNSYCYEPGNVHSSYNPYWDDGSTSYKIDSTDVTNMTQVYHPLENFAGFVGCPLNGNWHIEIEDLWDNDNGYLHEWEMALNPAMLPAEYDSFTVEGPWITMLNDTLFVVNPPADLAQDTVVSYTFSVHYDNTCYFDTTVFITCYAANHTLTDITICQSELPFMWNGKIFTETGTYYDTLTAVNGCDSVVTLNLAVINCASAIIDSKSCPTAPTVTDHEGNVYATVQIGSQCWMRDNLRTTTSPSTGTYLIPPAGTGYTYTGKQARWYNDDSTTYAPMNYGLLYNWNAAVDTFNTAYGETSVNSTTSNAVSVSFTGHRRGICPAGWHLPSDAEWTQLTTYVGSQSEYTCGGNSSYIAKALADSTGWNTGTNICAVGNDQSDNNKTGFSAFPAGFYYGSYNYSGYYAFFWSSTESNSDHAWKRYLGYNYARVSRNDSNKYSGFSVRCVRD